MNNDFFAFITIVPALAWFVAAFRDIYKMYRKHEPEIKEKVAETATIVEATAKTVTQGVEKKVKEIQEKNTQPPTPSDDSPTSEL